MFLLYAKNNNKERKTNKKHRQVLKNGRKSIENDRKKNTGKKIQENKKVTEKLSLTY